MHSHVPLTRTAHRLRRTAKMDLQQPAWKEFALGYETVHVLILRLVFTDRETPRGQRTGRDEIGFCPTRRVDRLRLQTS